MLCEINMMVWGIWLNVSLTFLTGGRKVAGKKDKKIFSPILILEYWMEKFFLLMCEGANMWFIGDKKIKLNEKSSRKLNFLKKYRVKSIKNNLWTFLCLKKKCCKKTNFKFTILVKNYCDQLYVIKSKKVE